MPDPEEKFTKVTFIMPKRMFEHLKMLARNRYGDDDEICRGKVVDDAVEWLLQKWQEYGYSSYDNRWSRMVSCPFKWIRRRAITKLILVQYFEGKK